MEIKKHLFQPHGDSRGQLIALEAFRDIPFEIKRVYYIYDTKADVARGFHAHKKLQQVLICVSGSCKIRLDDGKESTVVTLQKPSEGLYLSHNIWREMYDFSAGAVLLVLASEYYDEADYIRNYADFMKMIKEDEENKQ